MSNNIRCNVVRAIAIAGAFGLLGGCAQMHNMMGGESKSMRGENVTLSGANEVPPVTTSASGSGTVSVGGYQRSATSQSRWPPSRPATAMSPRRWSSSSICET